MASKGLKELRVAGNSKVKLVAGSVTKCLEENNDVEITTIGAAAANQCCKALAMARGFVATTGRDLMIRIGFATAIIEGEERTCLKFIVTAE